MLNELGFVWDLEEGTWTKQLAALDALLSRVGPQVCGWVGRHVWAGLGGGASAASMHAAT